MKRILVIRCGALGDLVYITSVIDALRYEYGNDTLIDFVTTPSTSKLFEQDLRVNKIYFLKHKKIPLWFSRQKKDIVKASKEIHYDLLINFEMGRQYKSLVENIVAKKRVGWFLENIVITKTHMVEICKELYASAVSSENLKKAYPRLYGTDFKEVQEALALPKKYIILSPSNSHHNKKRLNYRAWPHKNWKELLFLLPKDLSIVIIGAKGEEAFFEPLKPYCNNIIDLVGKIDIPTMISVIENAHALIVTDTGTAHIASAVNTPVFCLIGPTPAEQTGPYKTPHNHVEIISANLPCSPCYKTEIMKNCKQNSCMEETRAEYVMNRLFLAKIL